MGCKKRMVPQKERTHEKTLVFSHAHKKASGRMRTTAYNDDVASVSVSLRSLLDERHWRSVTPQTLECAEAQSLLYLKQKRICTFVIQM